MTVAQGTPISERLQFWIEGVQLVCDGNVPLNGPALVKVLEDAKAENAALSAQVAELDPEPVVCGCREALCPHTPVARLPRQALVDHFKARIKSIEADRDGLSAQMVELQKVLRAVLAHEFVEECQECAIGKSDAWEAAKVHSTVARASVPPSITDGGTAMARYQWLLKTMLTQSLHFRAAPNFVVQLCSNSAVLGQGPSRDAAIDAAMDWSSDSDG